MVIRRKLPVKVVNCPFCIGKMKRTGKILMGYDPHLKEYECQRCQALIYRIEKELAETP